MRNIRHLAQTVQWNLIDQLRLLLLRQCARHIGLDEAGATTFTVMPREPTSRASDFEKPMMPALAAA